MLLPCLWHYLAIIVAQHCQYGGKKLAKLYGFGNTASRQIKTARQQNDQTGELKAEGCDANGNTVSSYSIQSSGRPYALRVSADRTTLSCDRATAHLIVEIVDENGTIVKLGDNEITCTIEDPARLLGL